MAGGNNQRRAEGWEDGVSRMNGLAHTFAGDMQCPDSRSRASLVLVLADMTGLEV
jgi:hypothetical protein